MIFILLLVFVVSLAIAGLSFVIFPQLTARKRISLALCTFLVLGLAFVGGVYWLAYSDVGGRPVSQDELREAATP